MVHGILDNKKSSFMAVCILLVYIEFFEDTYSDKDAITFSTFSSNNVSDVSRSMISLFDLSQTNMSVT